MTFRTGFADRAEAGWSHCFLGCPGLGPRALTLNVGRREGKEPAETDNRNQRAPALAISALLAKLAPSYCAPSVFRGRIIALEIWFGCFIASFRTPGTEIAIRR